MVEAHRHDMQIILITGMTPSSAKKVRFLIRSYQLPFTKYFQVCVSSLLIAEIKRIVKDSEIMKYPNSNDLNDCSR